MKIFLPFFILMFSFSYSQTGDKEQILTDVSAMSVYTAQKNFDPIMDLTYPKLFEFFSRENMIQLLKDVFGGANGMRMEMDETPLDSFELSEISDFGDNGEKYVFISNPTVMRMIFAEELSEDEQENMLSFIGIGQEPKPYFIDNKTVRLSTNSTMIGVKDMTTNYQWRYVNLNSSDLEYLKIVLPEEIIGAVVEHIKSVD